MTEPTPRPEATGKLQLDVERLDVYQLALEFQAWFRAVAWPVTPA